MTAFSKAALGAVVLMTFCGPALADSTQYPNPPIEGRAKFVCEFLQNVIYGHNGRQLDKIGDYLTEGYIEHNERFAGVGIEHKRAAMAASPAFGPAEGCGKPVVIIDDGDFVVFLRQNKRMVDGEEKTVFQYDFFRFEGDKIAEHWD